MRTGLSKGGLPEGLTTVGLRTNRIASSSPWIKRPFAVRSRMSAGGDVVAEERWEMIRVA